MINWLKFWFQLYCEKERLINDQFDQLKNLVDIGDILGARGSIKRTEKGKPSHCCFEMVRTHFSLFRRLDHILLLARKGFCS